MSRFLQTVNFSGFLLQVLGFWFLFVCLFVCFHGEASNTMSECKYQDGPQNNFVLVRLKRLQVQSSCPEEIVRGFPDLLTYV